MTHEEAIQWAADNDVKITYENFNGRVLLVFRKDDFYVACAVFDDLVNTTTLNLCALRKAVEQHV